MIKQPTYLVIANGNKFDIANSGLAMIRDFNKGWFDVPLSFYKEFKGKFGIEGLEHSACRANITQEDILRANLFILSENFGSCYGAGSFGCLNACTNC